ncbi:hypothetical protein ACF0H5_024078 [Mactra antiquata]
MASCGTRRFTSCLKRFCHRGIHICDRYSLRTVFWSLILLATLGTMLIGASLENNTKMVIEQAQQSMFELENEFVKQSQEVKAPVNTSKPRQPFNPFDVPVNLKVNEEKEKEKPKETPKYVPKKSYLINWYNAPPYLRFRPDAMHCGFQKCKYKNCNVTFERKDRAISDAVLFDGRWVFEKVGFIRPPGQVWVFAAHETPTTFEDLGGWWKKPQWRYGFNWTMTYDINNTDIYLPYGEIRKRLKPVVRDFKKIAALKTNGALMINSHCNTSSVREKYVDILKKHFPVNVLGKCGTPWNCGTHYIHDDCFNLLNTTYKFFLAFENAFCNQYFSEKIYENFDYDTVIVTRGGSYKEAKRIFPKGTVISTDDFRTIEGLGKYLGKLAWSINDYADILRRKSQYYSVGYTAVYQRAMCDLCERMNNLDKYKKIIPDIVDWAYNKDPCRGPSDLV